MDFWESGFSGGNGWSSPVVRQAHNLNLRFFVTQLSRSVSV